MDTRWRSLRAHCLRHLRARLEPCAALTCEYGDAQRIPIYFITGGSGRVACIYCSDYIRQRGNTVSEITTERDHFNKRTIIIVPDEVSERVGHKFRASPIFSLPSSVVEAAIAVGMQAYKDTKPSYQWAAEQKRKRILKLFPFLRYTEKETT